VVFIGTIHVKIRDGQLANRLVYATLDVTAEPNCDILGLRCGEGAKYW
jgi:transposase-like protein